MSQADFLRGFDAMAFGAFQAAGVGDRARYTAPGAVAGVPCDVLVDRQMTEYGNGVAEVAASHVVVGFQRAQVQPVRLGALVLLRADGTDGEAFRLDAEVEGLSDESIVRWVVSRG